MTAAAFAKVQCEIVFSMLKILMFSCLFFLLKTGGDLWLIRVHSV